MRGRKPRLNLSLTIGFQPDIKLNMKVIAQLKLQTTEEQHEALLETLERANAACNYISERAWEEKTFQKFDLHKLIYYPAKEQFQLSAQVTIRCIAKVSDAYQLDKKREFRPKGSISYDDRILRYSENTVSIWTARGRKTIPFLCGENQRRLLDTRQGESDLIYRNGAFYLHVVCNIDEPPTDNPNGFLGVDLGVVNIAADSDGEIHTAEAVENVRVRFSNLRAQLQSVGTKSAKRKLKHVSGKEKRFRTDKTHCISKRIVLKAKGTRRGIALEDLNGIRERTTVKKSQRARHHTWSFNQLRQFVSYKAQMYGVSLQVVDPRNTSRTCPSCGHVDKKNRKSQAEFVCTSCSFSGIADVIAARNIAVKAACQSA